MSAPRLLIIDHDPAVQRAVESALGAEGCEVTAVGDGLTALDVALATTPDVILADYRMEGTNVFRFLEKLKQKNVLKNVAFLLLVNPGDVYDELTLRLVGVTDFLRKPLNPKETIDRVKRYSPIPTPVPAASAASPAAEPAPAKIEDLLGWSQDAPSPFSELSQDRSAGFDFSMPAGETSSSALDTTQFLDRNELTPSDNFTTADDSEPAFAGLQDAPFSPEMDAAEPLSSTPTPLPIRPEPPTPVPAVKPQVGTERNGNTSLLSREVVDGVSRDVARQVVEKVAWDVVPGLAKESLERVVNEIVERIVWEVVPSIAEAAIKKELERLTRDNG